MKKITLINLIALLILSLNSCKKDDVTKAQKQVLDLH